MKRILHVVGGMNQGGIENLLMNIYRNIDRKKIQFDFLVNRDGVFDNEIRSLGGNIYNIPSLQSVGYFKYKKNLNLFFQKHQGEYRIVHSHMDKVSGLILECAKNNNIPIRIAHSHSSSPSKKIAIRVFKELLGYKIEHNVTHRFACSSDAAKFLFKNNYLKAFYIKNGIETEKFAFSSFNRKEIRDFYNIDDETILIGNIARFTEYKNHTFLLDIFSNYHKKNTNSILMLIGDGELKEKIKNKIELLNLSDYVILVEPTKEAYKYYSAFDFFLLPSKSEGLGIVLIEAQICGVNCMASARCVPKEAKISNKLKFMSLDCSAEEWSKNIRISERNKDNAIFEDYSISTVVNELSSFYLNEKEDCLKNVEKR